MHVQERIEQALSAALASAEAPGCPPRLAEAMRHAVFPGGARIRPQLCLAVAKACGDRHPRLADAAAAAIELLHCASLVHDDLPCMDDDDLRRGKPTVHKAYDEATAVLAGDALQTLAFEILADPQTHADPGVRCQLVMRFAEAAGARGMVGGQMMDMIAHEIGNDIAAVTRMQRLKTGALIGCALEAGAIMGRASDDARAALHAFAHDLGLAYQIVDDLLDAEGDPDAMGKAVRKDCDAGKATFVTLLGLDGARERVRLLADQARAHLGSFGSRAHYLRDAVELVLQRSH